MGSHTGEGEQGKATGVGLFQETSTTLTDHAVGVLSREVARLRRRVQCLEIEVDILKNGEKDAWK